MTTRTIQKKTIFVGVSGGVDSSVSAALLKEQGYDVVGVFIKVWQPEGIACTWREERRDAMRVCATLGIPFLFMDLEADYKRGVADYMIAEYRLGRTPNPDVMCNKEVKFGAFLKKALEMGADAVATGHYARVSCPDPLPASPLAKGRGTQLLSGLDLGKDQSYFLWTLTQEQLSKILFPIGHLQKREVRRLAEKYKLPTAQKKDSQGVCFIGKLDMKDFLKQFIESKEGKVLNTEGEEIGYHDGAVFYTLGERHGFTITQKGTADGRYYVVDKDMERNTITVAHDVNSGTDPHPASPLLKGRGAQLRLSQTNWIPSAPIIGKKYLARTRYRQTLEECEFISFDGTTATVRFTDPQPTATPGQSLVVYDGEICVGGGIIE